MAIIIKNQEEITQLRESGRILGETLDLVIENAKEGISTAELDKIAEDHIRAHNAKPGFKGFQGFPYTLCTAVDEIIVHGFPSEQQILKEGDLFTVDCGVLYNGLYTDAARSIIIGKKTTPEKERLIATAKKALKAATKVAQPGNHLNEIGKAIQNIVEAAGFYTIHDLTGHGIGRNLHEDPIILNYYEGDPGTILKPGMVIAIEPIFSTGSSDMRTLTDGWTIGTADNSPSVQQENTILITENGNEILTKTKH